MRKIIIFTGNELRHCYFCQFLSQKSYCESMEKSLKILFYKIINKIIYVFNTLIKENATNKNYFGIV